MRYLRKYNESEEYIKDILQELEDDNYLIQTKINESVIYLRISNPPKDIFPSIRNWFSLIKPNILSLIYYMLSENFEYFVYSNGYGHLRTLNQYEEKLKSSAGNSHEFKIIFVLKDEIH